MGSDSNLNTWVSDKLMALLGYSTPIVAEFVIGLTKEANSPASMVDKLVGLGFSSSTETGTFAEEIFARVCGQTSGLEQCQMKKRFRKRKLSEENDDDHEVIAQEEERRVRRQNSPDEDDHEDDSKSEERLRDQREREKLEQNIRKREAAATPKQTKTNFFEDVKLTEEEKRGLSYKKQILDLTAEQILEHTRKALGLDEAENGSESEEERLRDQMERKQLEQNMRKRDEAATRKLTKKNLGRKEEEEAVRNSSADIEYLRRVSRQEYLKKRAKKKLAEMRDDVEDEGYLFAGVKLTETEQRELNYKKQILVAVHRYC